MQDRWVGDIGDYAKFAILRALSPGRRLGVAWWLHPTYGPRGDGTHIGYLDAPQQWKHLDPVLFDVLRRIVGSGQRHISAIERENLIPGTAFFGEPVPIAGPASSRPVRRSEWLSRLDKSLRDSDLLFIDPDNGLEPARFDTRSARAGRSVSLDEMRALARPERTLIVYHHQTRRAGGHLEELAYWADRLRRIGFERVDVLRARPFSVRAFFILGSDDVMRHRAAELARRWANRISWHPDETLLSSITRQPGVTLPPPERTGITEPTAPRP